MAAGIQSVHVAFKGLPEALVEIAAGRLNYGLISLGPALPFIQDKRVVALAQIAEKRAPALPNVPLMKEALPGFERDATHAVIAPAGTPRGIVNQISQDIARVLELPDVKQRMEVLAFEPAPMTPEEHNRQLRRLHESISKVVVALGLRAR
jgi:tripartite-type tricarboxylate transporter receptor subunit TctC